MRTEKELLELVDKINNEKNILIFNIGRTDGYHGNELNERYKDLASYQLGFEEGEEWRLEEYNKHYNLTL